MATAKTTRGKPAAAARAATAEKPEGSNKALKVVPKVDGFRRASRAFAGETTIPLSELTDEQYTQLTTEPMLVTAVVDLPADQADAGAAPT